MKPFITILFGSFLPLFSQAAQPNIVLVFIDDMGWGDKSMNTGVKWPSPAKCLKNGL